MSFIVPAVGSTSTYVWPSRAPGGGGGGGGGGVDSTDIPITPPVLTATGTITDPNSILSSWTVSESGVHTVTYSGTSTLATSTMADRACMVIPITDVYPDWDPSESYGFASADVDLSGWANSGTGVSVGIGFGNNADHTSATGMGGEEHDFGTGDQRFRLVNHFTTGSASSGQYPGATKMTQQWLMAPVGSSSRITAIISGARADDDSQRLAVPTLNYNPSHIYLWFGQRIGSNTGTYTMTFRLKMLPVKHFA